MAVGATVLWANLSATPGSPYALGGAAELSDLIGGLVLNSTGALTCDLLNITGALPTLDLPANVLSVLANYTAPNNGSYAPPQFDPEAVQPVESFTQFLQDVWNTLSGVASAIVSGLETIVSVVWSVDTAAQAYIAGAVAGTVTSVSHGLASLQSQTATALRDLAQAMSWALELAVSWFVQHVLSPALRPVIDGVTLYTDDLAADLDPNPAQFSLDFSSTFFAMVVGLALAVTIAVALVQDLVPGAFTIALLVAAVLIGSVGAISKSSHASSFEGCAPFSQQVVNNLDSVLQPTDGSQLAISLGDLATVLTGITSTWAVQAVETAAKGDVDFSDAMGFGLGVVALLMSGVASAVSSVQDAVVSFYFDVVSIICDFAAVIEGPVDSTLTAVTFVLDGLAGVADAATAYVSGAWG
jgi:hypothetical protein